MTRVYSAGRLLWMSAVLAATACSVDHEPSAEAPATERRLALDNIETAPEGMHLLVLDPESDRRALTAALETLGGSALHFLPPRLLVARVPSGNTRVLSDLGVVRDFDGVVPKGALDAADVREERFVRLYNSRYHAERIDREERVEPKHLVRPEGESFEIEAPSAPVTALTKSLAKPSGDPAEDAEANVFVPYASGRIVVAVVLPESNGVAEPSTEDWTEDAIVETYQKIQAGLEGIQRHEPNSQLDFVLHYASAPGRGALPGTIDCDYEAGKHARGSEHLGKVYSQIYSQLLDRPLGEYEGWAAQSEYLQTLKQQYDADGAFVVYVAANQNYSAGFRAYASINGPSTWLDSSYGFAVFMHEFGHIFGALDEYCPDACISPSAQHGYLGIVNANATFRYSTWGGALAGKGEDASSLMMANVVNGVNGYTRGAFGWLDTDGDGLLEVRDTFPKSELSAQVQGAEVSLVGRIVDVPQTSNGFTPYSVNRIQALHVRFGDDANAPFIRYPLAADTRGRQLVALSLGAFPSGEHTLYVRAENSVGNLEPTPRRVDVPAIERGTRSAPRVSLRADLDVASLGSLVTLSADSADLDGERLWFRFDVDGDGRFDTSFSTRSAIVMRPRRTGRTNVTVEARDARGLTSRAALPLLIVDRNASPRVALAALPSPLVGQPAVDLAVSATITDAERNHTSHTLELELDDAGRSFSEKTDLGSSTSHTARLSTPSGLPVRAIDMLNLDSAAWQSPTIHDVVRVDRDVLAVAMGQIGVLFVDTATAQPSLITRIEAGVEARDLFVEGTRLYVLGDKLTSFDVQNPRAPVLVPQRKTTRNRRVLVQSDAPIDEGGTKGLPFFPAWSETITGASLDLILGHSAPAEVRIELELDDRSTLVLAERLAGRPGIQRLRFTERDALSTLVGRIARGELRLRVIDGVENGSKGQVFEARLTLQTEHRAIDVLEDAQEIVGHHDPRVLVISGRGLEMLDVSHIDDVRSLAQLEGGFVAASMLVDRGVLVYAPLDPEKRFEAERLGFFGDVEGLSFVDLTLPFLPRVSRTLPDFVGDDLVMLGSRFYFTEERPGEPGEKPRRVTVVGDGRAFGRGRPFRLAETDVTIGRGSFGDDHTVYRTVAEIEAIDVRDASRIRVVERFVRPSLWYAKALGPTEAVAIDQSLLLLVDLSERFHGLSQTYRVKLRAEDTRGGVSEASRAVHVIPYDHAPVVDGVTLVGPSTTRDPVRFTVAVRDADEGQSWDPMRAVRIDFDGDGHFDGPWHYAGQGYEITHLYPTGGDYVVRVQARDGFHALSEVFTLPIHVETYTPIACSDSSVCPTGEYCELAAVSCGDAGQGQCEPRRDDCYGAADPVCGCDGVTYRNACDAQAKGVSAAHPGVCEGEQMACGGRDGLSCSVPDMVCIYPIGATSGESCGGDGSIRGECMYPPDGCFIPYGRIGIPRPQSVCGCDGQTYQTECEATRAGVSVERYGSCEEPPDCRSEGCEAGAYCQYCWSGYVCMPEGSAC